MENSKYKKMLANSMQILANEFKNLGEMCNDDNFNDQVNELISENYPFDHSLDEMGEVVKAWADDFMNQAYNV